MTLLEFKNLSNMNHPLEHLEYFLDATLSKFQSNGCTSKEEIELIKYTGAIKLFCKEFKLDKTNILDNINNTTNYSDIHYYLNLLYKYIAFEGAESSFEDHFQSITYEFEKDELLNLNNIIDELIEKINESNIFDEIQLKNINRLLLKLKKEINKNIHSMTTIFGIITELGLKFNIIPKAKKIFLKYIAGMFKITINVNIKANNLPVTNDFQIPFSSDTNDNIRNEVILEE